MALLKKQREDRIKVGTNGSIPLRKIVVLANFCLSADTYMLIIGQAVHHGAPLQI